MHETMLGGNTNLQETKNQGLCVYCEGQLSIVHSNMQFWMVFKGGDRILHSEWYLATVHSV